MDQFLSLCSELGMITHQLIFGLSGYLPVLFEGNILGLVNNENSIKFCDNLRYNLKHSSSNTNNYLKDLSITLIQENIGQSKQTFYPGIYLSANEGRFLRKVFNNNFSFIETIDPLEQTFLKISIGPNEFT